MAAFQRTADPHQDLAKVCTEPRLTDAAFNANDRSEVAVAIGMVPLSQSGHRMCD